MEFTIIVARISAFGFLSSLIACLSMAREPIDDVRGDLLKIEDLPRLRTGIQTHQFCTYDRAGDNYDWDYFVLYTEPNGEVVLFDATGPGCLYRHQMNLWMSAGRLSKPTRRAFRFATISTTRRSPASTWMFPPSSARRIRWAFFASR